MPDFPRMLKYYIMLTAASVLVGFTVMFFFDNLPRVFMSIPFLQKIAPLTPIIGIGIIEFLEFAMVHRMWTKRQGLLATLKDKAYQHSFFYICFGMNLEYVVITRMFLPTPWVEEIGKIFATPLLSFVSVWIPYTSIIRIVAGISFLAIGLTLLYRSTMTFGLDYLLYMYLYFPEGSEIQRNAIYSIVRHPTYLSFILMNFGGALWWFSAYSFTFFLIIVIRWEYHIHFVEEKELIERFGESYRRYQKSVPAFVCSPKRVKQFFQFLLGKL
ncbi:MAG: isoprenylcysteine carboxylmethyltransferase family protein [Candidatus Sigynarchaeota archaeon]